MSKQKKQKNIITNQKLLMRLKRLPLVSQLKTSELIAYVGLLLVNKGNAISITKALKIIHASHLDRQIETNIYIPCTNVLEALICTVIYKRKLVKKFIEHEEFEVWQDEYAAPLFDIMKDIMEIYKI